VVAAALTVYCLLTAAIFHTSLSDQVQNLMLLKNIAMTGGFMLPSYVGGGPVSIDGKLATPSLRVISGREVGAPFLSKVSFPTLAVEYNCRCAAGRSSCLAVFCCVAMGFINKPRPKIRHAIAADASLPSVGNMRGTSRMRRFLAASPTGRAIRRCSNYRSSKRRARASLRSVVSNPSVKRLYTRANVCRA
jgi:hypothetical protein